MKRYSSTVYDKTKTDQCKSSKCIAFSFQTKKNSQNFGLQIVRHSKTEVEIGLEKRPSAESQNLEGPQRKCFFDSNQRRPFDYFVLGQNNKNLEQRVYQTKVHFNE